MNVQPCLKVLTGRVLKTCARPHTSFFTSHISEEEIRLLGQVGFPQERCINYLTPDEAHEEIRAAWQNREYDRSALPFLSSFHRLLTITEDIRPISFASITVAMKNEIYNG